MKERNVHPGTRIDTIPGMNIVLMIGSKTGPISTIMFRSENYPTQLSSSERYSLNQQRLNILI
jgi:hypothetical protein